MRGAILTAGAVVGSLCLLVALAGAMFGVKPLVFKSGSMGPSIPAGALALSRPVDASDIRVGDVVSTMTAERVRVTHRVVAVSGTGRGRELTLRGDANPTPDQQSYRVTRVDRVFWSVPWLGRVVAFLGTPIGLILLGAFGISVLYLGFRRPRGGGGAHSRCDSGGSGSGRRRAAVVVSTLMSVVALTAAPTWAFWTDATAASGAGVLSYTLKNPVGLPTPGNCSASNGLLGSTITFKWTGVTPDPAPRAQIADYEYQLKFIDRGSGATLNTVTVAHSGAAGSQQSYQSSASTLGGLLGLNLASQNNVRLEIYTHLKNAQWYGPAPVTTNWTVTTLLGIATFSCNA